MGLLRFAAEGEEDREQHGDAERVEAGSMTVDHFFVEDEYLAGAPVRTAVLHRPDRRDPALGVENFPPALNVGFAHGDALVDLVTNIRR
jgi:hypothetical protein